MARDDVIVGNPPFLGNYRLRSELGDSYVEDLFLLYKGKIPGGSDLVCYWFEKARNHISHSKAERAGFIATNSIRGGANRHVLKRIKISGDIFLAWSDKPWILDGAAVRVSIVGFDNGYETDKRLDGNIVSTINPDLTSTVDVTPAVTLKENAELCFRCDEQGGPFDIDAQLAQKMIRDINNSGLPNSDVVRPYTNALDITRRPREMWIIDFGVDASIEEASKYEMPFEYVLRSVKPIRDKSRAKKQREMWWLHRRPGPDMRKAISKLERYIATPMVSKHRLFVWFDGDVISAHMNYAIARDDDYFLGVLHARPHELWALRQGTSLGPTPRYTPTSTFETFPFPWSPGYESSEDEDYHVAEISHWARELVGWRDTWLNPPPPPSNVVDIAYQKMLKSRTLTNLYNGLVYYRETKAQGQLWDSDQFAKVTRKSVTRSQVQELDDIHRALDKAVLDAYGWPHDLTDEQILEHLLALNLERAAAQEKENGK